MLLQTLPPPPPMTSPPAGKRPRHHSPPPPTTPSDEPRLLRLLTLLLHCAESVSLDRLPYALSLLPELSSLSSPFASSPERVSAYFSDALRSRILSSLLSSYSPLPLPPLSLNSFHSLNSLSPLLQFSHSTSNQAILLSLSPRHRRLHIIDLDILHGLQWPPLFQLLSSRRPALSLRITALGPAAPILQATGRSLAQFAAALQIPFDFVPIQGKFSDLADPARFGAPDPAEAVAVHWTQHCVYDAVGSDDVGVRIMRAIRPDVVTLVERDLSHGGDFLCRFVEALHYYCALFDAIGEGGGGGEERWEVERGVFGGEIRNIVAVGGPKRTGEVRVERWGEELRREGFRQVSLAGSPAEQARLLLGMAPWNGYTLVEEGGRLKLGWKDLSLLTASAWRSPGAGDEEDEVGE